MTKRAPLIAAAIAPLLLLGGCLQGDSDVIPDADRAAPLAMGRYQSCTGEECEDAFLYLDPKSKGYVLIRGEEATTAEAFALGKNRFLIYGSAAMGGGLQVGEKTGENSMTVRQPDCDRIKGALEPYLKEHAELHADDDVCEVENIEQAKKYVALIEERAPGAYDPDKELKLTLVKKVD